MCFYPGFLGGAMNRYKKRRIARVFNSDLLDGDTDPVACLKSVALRDVDIEP